MKLLFQKNYWKILYNIKLMMKKLKSLLNKRFEFGQEYFFYQHRKNFTTLTRLFFLLKKYDSVSQKRKRVTKVTLFGFTLLCPV